MIQNLPILRDKIVYTRAGHQCVCCLKKVQPENYMRNITFKYKTGIIVYVCKDCCETNKDLPPYKELK